MSRLARLALVGLGILAVAAPAAATNLDLESPAPSQLLMSGFEVDGPTNVHVDAQGLRLAHDRDTGSWVQNLGERLFHSDREEIRGGCYAWILDANSRQTVWVLDLEEADRGDGKNHRREATDLELPAGQYQIFLYGGHDRLHRRSRDENLSRAEKAELEAVQDDLAKCYLRVEGSGLREKQPSGRCDDALVALVEVGDSQLRRQAFEIDRDAKLAVYGLMEQSPGNDDPADYGWIVDLDNGARVWDMSDRHGHRAGGALKNRVLRRDVRLDAGRYMLVYGTDDSHAAGEFNAPPPYDPLAWGVQIRPTADYVPGSLRLIDTPKRLAPAIDFSRSGDGEFHEQPFRLDQPTDLHIYVLGESTDGGWSWADHGWILDAATRQTVWDMDGRNSLPAGGASKNRMFDGVLRFPAGDYIACYITDGSHAYGDWNSAAPFDPEAWGMQIAVEPDQDIELLSRDELPGHRDLLVDLTRVRNDQTRRERFTLDAPTEVEIFAVGEGTGGEMDDWGRLRSVDDDRTVWEMDYDATDHAGGARKNRMEHHRMRLDPGEYEAIYQTDGSHAFGDWNADAPDDPLSWGMIVRRVR